MGQMCPTVPPGTSGTCAVECTDNSECNNGQLCCSNGCGRVCVGPVDNCAVS